MVVTLKKISDMRTNEIMIMASIYSAVTIIYKTKLLIETGYSNSEIELELGLKGFVLNRNISRANRIKRSSLDKMIEICAEADISSKSTSSDASVIISELIASLIETV